MAKSSKSDDGFSTFGEAEGGENLVLNMSEVKEASFEPVPAGNYRVAVSGCEYQISQSSSKPMWSMVFDIVDGEFAGRKLFAYWSFSEKAIPMTKGNIKAVNPAIAELTSFDPKKIAENGEMLGFEANARVVQEKGNDGEMRNVVKRMRPVGEAGEDGDGGGAFAGI